MKTARLMFASVLALALASGVAYAQDAKATGATGTDAPKATDTGGAAPAPAGAGEFQHMKAINDAFKACKKDAKDKDAKTACAKTKKDAVAANKAKVKETAAKHKEALATVKAQLKDCKKAKDKDGVKAHNKWIKDARKWLGSVKTYASKGKGEAPSWDAPAAPPACAAGGDKGTGAAATGATGAATGTGTDAATK